MSRILLDGRDVSSHVGRAALTVLPAGDVTMVLHLAKLTPFVNDYAKAVVDPGTADLLQWLGWTPPETETEGDGS